MLLHVIDCQWLGGRILRVGFSDGRSGTLEFEPHVWSEWTQPLRSSEYVAQFHLNPETFTLEWPNGYDIAPEYLYFLAFREDPMLQDRFAQWGYTQGKAAAATIG